MQVIGGKEAQSRDRTGCTDAKAAEDDCGEEQERELEDRTPSL